MRIEDRGLKNAICFLPGSPIFNHQSSTIDILRVFIFLRAIGMAEENIRDMIRDMVKDASQLNRIYSVFAFARGGCGE